MAKEQTSRMVERSERPARLDWSVIRAQMTMEGHAILSEVLGEDVPSVHSGGRRGATG